MVSKALCSLVRSVMGFEAIGVQETPDRNSLAIRLQIWTIFSHEKQYRWQNHSEQSIHTNFFEPIILSLVSRYQEKWARSRMELVRVILVKWNNITPESTWSNHSEITAKHSILFRCFIWRGMLSSIQITMNNTSNVWNSYVNRLYINMFLYVHLDLLVSLRLEQREKYRNYYK